MSYSIWEKVCSYRFTSESLINLLIACNGTEYVRSSVTGDNKHEGGDSNGAWEKVRLRSLTRALPPPPSRGLPICESTLIRLEVKVCFCVVTTPQWSLNQQNQDFLTHFLKTSAFYLNSCRQESGDVLNLPFSLNMATNAVVHAHVNPFLSGLWQ